MARIREVAQRVFAVEYNGSQHEDRGLEENAPNYVITPLGTSANRVYFTGVMMTKTNTGSEDSPQFRVEVRDPTGTFYLYAGQFQPDAINSLSQLEAPSLVGVVGKVRTFVKDDGTFYASVKPEVIFPVDVPQRDRWILQTVKFTLDRIRAVKDAMEMEDPDADALVEKGHSRRAAEEAVNAVGLYGNIELDPLRDGLKRAVDLVIEGGGEKLEEEPSAEIKEEEKAPRSKDNEEIKKTILDIIEELSDDKGALYRDIITECEKKRIDKIELEETIQNLLEEGQIYEPTIGIIKPI
ncbi:MAG: hypothetical protein R6V01_00125 [Thermoplasmatota archaeon]